MCVWIGWSGHLCSDCYLRDTTPDKVEEDGWMFPNSKWLQSKVSMVPKHSSRLNSAVQFSVTFLSTGLKWCNIRPYICHWTYEIKQSIIWKSNVLKMASIWEYKAMSLKPMDTKLPINFILLLLSYIDTDYWKCESILLIHPSTLNPYLSKVIS